MSDSRNTPRASVLNINNSIMYTHSNIFSTANGRLIYFFRITYGGLQCLVWIGSVWLAVMQPEHYLLTEAGSAEAARVSVRCRGIWCCETD